MMYFITFLISFVVFSVIILFLIDSAQSKKRYMLILNNTVYYFRTKEEMDMCVRSNKEYAYDCIKFVEVDGKYIYLGSE